MCVDCVRNATQKDADLNITQRANGIYMADLKVPAEVRHIIGKARLTQSLRTRDRRIAQQEAGPILAEWDRQIRLAREEPDAILEELAVARTRINLEREKGQEALDEWGYTDTESKLEAKGYTNEDWLESLPPSQAEKYMNVMWGEGMPLPQFMEAFIKAHYTKHRTKTEARRYILEATLFVPTLELINTENAKAWVRAETQKPNEKRRAVKTMQKATGYLSEYVLWLQDQRLLSESVANPFRNLRYPKALKQKEPYAPLSYDEILSLRAAAQAKADSELVAFIDIGRFTGMRLAEIGALNTSSVEVIDGRRCFRVKLDAKTKKSAGRLVPLAAMLDRLLTTNGFELNNFDLGRRDNAVGKRFGRLKKEVLPDGDKRTKCFHSIRKFVATTLEQAQIPEGVAADLVGHEKNTMTYGVYSGGSALVQLSKAVEALEAAQPLPSEHDDKVFAIRDHLRSKSK